jgi:hypothetical protein
MSSYFIRRCSGFSLIMTLRSHVSAGLSGCCGESNFVCSHWERKGMSTDVCLFVSVLSAKWDQCFPVQL